MIFRGILQQFSAEYSDRFYVGIWITAILFSAVHFQFFGFLPRLILVLALDTCFSGLEFWLPVYSSFFNNAVPVVMSYFIGWTDLNDKSSDYWKINILPLVPVLLCFGYFIISGRSTKKNLIETCKN